VLYNIKSTTSARNDESMADSGSTDGLVGLPMLVRTCDTSVSNQGNGEEGKGGGFLSCHHAFIVKKKLCMV